MSLQVQTSADGSEYVLVNTNDKGAVKQETLHADKALTPEQCARALSAQVKGLTAFRAAAVTFLGLVYQQQALNGYAASADKATGKVSNEFKAAVRDAETATVRAMVEAGTLKLKDEQAIQTYLSALREDKNYSNAKVTTNRYFGVVGANCVTKNGYLVPVPVMQAQIREAMPEKEKDDSLATQIRSVLKVLQEGTFADSDALMSLSLASALKDQLTKLCDTNAEIATNKHAATGVVGTAIHEGAVVSATTDALKTAMAVPVGAPKGTGKRTVAKV